MQRVLLFDFSIHFIHLALLFGGPVSSLRFVDAEINSAGLKYLVFGTLHEGGCRGLFKLMLDSPCGKTDIEVLGETGGFALDFFPHGLRMLPRRDTPLHRAWGDIGRLTKFGYSEVRGRLPGGIPDRAVPHSRLFLAFIEAIRKNAPNPVTYGEVIETISLLTKVADQAYGLGDALSRASSRP
jgi:predicted dehydrogenase